MVTVKANGAGEVLEIKISPEGDRPDDAEMLEDLVLAGVNEALRAARPDAVKVGGSMGGLGLPGCSAGQCSWRSRRPRRPRRLAVSARRRRPKQSGWFAACSRRRSTTSSRS